MIKGLYSAAKSLHEKMKNIEIVANNLANINTTGFKREIPFSEYMSRYENQPMQQVTDFTEGAFIETTNPFNMAISGSGFFMVETSRGIELTKNGNFNVTDDGFLVNEKGNRVLGRQGPINIFESVFNKNDNVTIAKNGEIKIGGVIIDQLMMAKLNSQQNVIRSEGQNFYNAQGDYLIADEGEYEIHQGYLEESNTSAITEMQEMIKLNKEFESSQKMIAAMDNAMGKANEMGKV